MSQATVPLSTLEEGKSPVTYAASEDSIVATWANVRVRGFDWEESVTSAAQTRIGAPESESAASADKKANGERRTGAEKNEVRKRLGSSLSAR